MGFGNLLRRDNRAYFGLDFVFGTIPNELIPFDYDTFAAYPGEVEAVRQVAQLPDIPRPAVRAENLLYLL